MTIQNIVTGERSQEAEILDFMNRLWALGNLDDVLREIVREAPRLVNSKGCTVYLTPRLVEDYDGRLIDEHGHEVNGGEIEEDFIVLAAHSSVRESAAIIGKHFYRRGEGLTGWVFKRAESLLLDNIDKQDELGRYDGLQWKNKYDGVQYYFDPGERLGAKPFLGVPLLVGKKCLGVIRVATSQDGKPFPFWAKDMFVSFGHVISKRIEIDLIIQGQQQSIENLIGIGANIRIGTPDSERKALGSIVNEVQRLVNASRCNLYLLNKYGEVVELMVTTDGDVEKRRLESDGAVYGRGEGFTGWIFKTGKPLLIDDTTVFAGRRTLSNADLLQYSDSAVINDDDREIGLASRDAGAGSAKLTRFLGVPLLSAGGKTQGVLEALSRGDENAFTQRDLKLLQDFAKNVSLLLADVDRQKLNNTLIRIGQEYGDQLFRYVTDTIPGLVWARYCSIFLRADEPDVFELRYTNSPLLMEDGDPARVKKVRYKVGVGKTGLVAKVGRCLVINHYGPGNLDYQRLQADFGRYADDRTNLVRLLKDDDGNDVALARLIQWRTELPFSEEEKEEFERFVGATVFRERGLPSNEEMHVCEEGEGGFARSFLASPLKDRQGNIYGVMRIPRFFPGGSFTEQDLDWIVSVSNRLSSVLERENIVEQNLRTLGEINRQINSSFDSPDPNHILSRILEAVTETLGFEFATIQLVDPDRRNITTRMVLKNQKIEGATDPGGWMGASHPLKPAEGERQDIHAWVLCEHRRPHIARGWDEHFDRDIFERYDHANLVRAFIPIVAQSLDQEVDIGTLEAGHSMDRRSFIEEKEVVMLKALADQAAIAIRNRNLRDELVKSERLLLVPDMAHILQSPASELTMLLGQLTKEFSQPALNVTRVKEYVELGKAAALTMLTMSRTLSAEVALRVEPQDRRRVDLEECLNLQPPWLGSYDIRIELVKRLGQKVFLPMTGLERTWLDIILLNLLHNAVKYSPPGGLIEVVCAREDDGSVAISVADEGPGIPGENLPQIFEPGFHTLAKGWPEGTGLGLYRVRQLLQKLEWSCEAGNRASRGAKFVMRIPAGWRAAV